MRNWCKSSTCGVEPFKLLPRIFHRITVFLPSFVNRDTVLPQSGTDLPLTLQDSSFNTTNHSTSPSSHLLAKRRLCPACPTGITPLPSLAKPASGIWCCGRPTSTVTFTRTLFSTVKKTAARKTTGRKTSGTGLLGVLTRRTSRRVGGTRTFEVTRSASATMGQRGSTVTAVAFMATTRSAIRTGTKLATASALSSWTRSQVSSRTRSGTTSKGPAGSSFSATTRLATTVQTLTFGVTTTWRATSFVQTSQTTSSTLEAISFMLAVETSSSAQSTTVTETPLVSTTEELTTTRERSTLLTTETSSTQSQSQSATPTQTATPTPTATLSPTTSKTAWTSTQSGTRTGTTMVVPAATVAAVCRDVWWGFDLGLTGSRPRGAC